MSTRTLQIANRRHAHDRAVLQLYLDAGWELVGGLSPQGLDPDMEVQFVTVFWDDAKGEPIFPDKAGSGPSSIHIPKLTSGQSSG